jgi:hypothetical protein
LKITSEVGFIKPHSKETFFEWGQVIYIKTKEIIFKF